jgi:hypothetical protein
MTYTATAYPHIFNFQPVHYSGAVDNVWLKIMKHTHTTHTQHTHNTHTHTYTNTHAHAHTYIQTDRLTHIHTHARKHIRW